ncbi:MAG: hypothetical protein EOO69_08120 [Moraxellaceae bacterium]|nr:MAG: hypothetical protein EOO69_08120 [Moraxellaceae bacterium]
MLPLIDRLAQEKPIAQGLLIGEHQTTPHWPGEWQSIALHELETLAFNRRYDLAVMTLYSSYYEANLTANNPALPINQSDSPDDSKNQHTLKNQHDFKHQQILTQGITRLRDLLARRVLVLASPEFGASLHALGFSQIEQLPQNLVIWQFNILAYKQVPDWLNSKYWANPENWNKYRW